MCRVFGVHRSGYYAWLRCPFSERAKENRRLTGLVKQVWLESGGIYGQRKVSLDLKDLGEVCSKHRAGRLMKAEGLRALVGYGCWPRPRGGKPSRQQQDRSCRTEK